MTRPTATVVKISLVLTSDVCSILDTEISERSRPIQNYAMKLIANNLFSLTQALVRKYGMTESSKLK